MADTAKVQIIEPPGRLRARMGEAFHRIDPEAVARAEAALQALSGQFDGWLEDEVAMLEDARDAILRDADPDALANLQSRAHDLKGLGGSFGFPLVTRICVSLCHLLDNAHGAHALVLASAHVDGVRRLVRDGARGADHLEGLALCQALEARVAAHTA